MKTRLNNHQYAVPAQNKVLPTIAPWKKYSSWHNPLLTTGIVYSCRCLEELLPNEVVLPHPATFIWVPSAGTYLAIRIIVEQGSRFSIVSLAMPEFIRIDVTFDKVPPDVAEADPLRTFQSVLLSLDTIIL